MKKYFIVGTPTDQYYPWVLYKTTDQEEPFLFNSLEEAKKAIAEYSRGRLESIDDFWIGEKIDFDIEEINAQRVTFE